MYDIQHFVKIYKLVFTCGGAAPSIDLVFC